MYKFFKRSESWWNMRNTVLIFRRSVKSNNFSKSESNGLEVFWQAKRINFVDVVQKKFWEMFVIDYNRLGNIYTDVY